MHNPIFVFCLPISLTCNHTDLTDNIEDLAAASVLHCHVTAGQRTSLYQTGILYEKIAMISIFLGLTVSV